MAAIVIGLCHRLNEKDATPHPETVVRASAVEAYLMVRRGQ